MHLHNAHRPVTLTTMPTATSTTTKPNGDISNLKNDLDEADTDAPQSNGNTTTQEAEATPLVTATSQLTNAVDEMLKQLQEKFGRVSEEMAGRSEFQSHAIDYVLGRVEAMIFSVVSDCDM